MAEILLAVLDEHGGNLLVDTSDAQIAEEIQADLAQLLGDPEGLACARPNTQTELAAPVQGVAASGGDVSETIRTGGLWHNSLIEGPGRRSVLRVQGCPIHCPGCYVPETWDPDTGEDFLIADVAATLLDPSIARDGVTILGGEPFAQPSALAHLVDALRAAQPDLHLLVYSGFTYESLRRRQDSFTAYVLAQIDVLIDGPYVLALSGGAGPWTGSANQRVIDMPATRASGRVVPWQS